VQLWILLAKLEELNTQFALWLDTLTIPKSTTKPNNTPGNQLHPLNALTVTTISIFNSDPTLNNKNPDLTPGATPATDPTGWLFLRMLPSDRQTSTVHTPPWPPPMQQTQCYKPNLPWYHMQIVHLFPTSDNCIFHLTQQ